MFEEKLKSIDIFSNLNENELKYISNISELKTLNKDNILFYEGDSSDHFYALLEGNLKLYKTGTKFNEIVLHYFTKPTLIAEMATLEGINFPASAVATKDDTLVAVINKEKFMNILKSDTDFSFHIIKSLTKKIKNLEVAINRNLIFDATSKVCSLIEEDPTYLTTHKNIEIANILNMAPETLSRVLGKLKKVGVLDSSNSLIDKEKLEIFLDF